MQPARNDSELTGTHHLDTIRRRQADTARRLAERDPLGRVSDRDRQWIEDLIHDHAN